LILALPEVGTAPVVLGTIDLHADIEHVEHPVTPLFDQRGRGQDQHSAGLAPGQQGPEDQARLDGLAQTDVVGHQPPGWPGLVHLAAHPELVGEKVDIGWRKDAPGIVCRGDGLGLEAQDRGQEGIPGGAPGHLGGSRLFLQVSHVDPVHGPVVELHDGQGPLEHLHSPGSMAGVSDPGTRFDGGEAHLSLSPDMISSSLSALQSRNGRSKASPKVASSSSRCLRSAW